MIMPEDNEAALDPSCCIAELKLRNAPRRSGFDAPATMAIAGTKRPDTKIMNVTITEIAIHNGAGGRLVQASNGMTDTLEMIVNM